MPRGEKYREMTGPAFEAQWNSRCGSGSDGIDAGEMIVMLDSEPWHAECATEAGYRVPNLET